MPTLPSFSQLLSQANSIPEVKYRDVKKRIPRLNDKILAILPISDTKVAAEQVGLCREAFVRRLKKLKEAGVIKRSVKPYVYTLVEKDSD